MWLIPGDRKKNRGDGAPTRPRIRRHPRVRKGVIALLAALLLLVAVRLALTPLLLGFVNQKLDEIPDYQGHIEDVDLFRGAYRIEGIRLDKASGKVPEPFFRARSVDLSVEWRALFKKSLVGEIEVVGPEVNFVAPPPKAGPKTKEEQGQTSIDASWTDKRAATARTSPPSSTPPGGPWAMPASRWTWRAAPSTSTPRPPPRTAASRAISSLLFEGS